MLEAFERYWHRDQADFVLLLDGRDPDAPRRHLLSAAGAAAVHVCVFVFLLNAPASTYQLRTAPDIVLDFKRAVPLMAPRNTPPFRLTQKEPQHSKPAAEVDMASLQPRPELRSAQQAPPGRPFTPPPPAAAQAPVIEAPKLEMAQAPLPVVAAPKLPSAPPPEPSKNPFEKVGGTSASTPSSPPVNPITPPKPTVDDAIRGVARSGGRVTVGDSGALGSGGVSEALAQPHTPGRPGSALELLSDPQGVDFRPYLVQVLAAVKRNWQAVFPESARFGSQGRVAIQFAIDRGGRVPKLVIAWPSGTEALDRAAVAGISASNPFPPLPTEFQGKEIRLQLVFSYNMPK